MPNWKNELFDPIVVKWGMPMGKGLVLGYLFWVILNNIDHMDISIIRKIKQVEKICNLEYSGSWKITRKNTTQ